MQPAQYLQSAHVRQHHVEHHRVRALILRGGQGFGAFKPKLAELAVEALAPITAEMRRLMADPAEIDRVLSAGAEQARDVAAPVVAETKRIVGFWQG